MLLLALSVAFGVLCQVPMALLILTILTVFPTIINAGFYIFYATARLVEHSKPTTLVPVPPFLRGVREHFQCRVVVALDAVARLCAHIIRVYGRVFHSYQVVGLENIPLDRPALLIYYHGVVPSDMVFLPMETYFRTGRIIRGIADRFLFLVPVWGWIVRDYIFTGPASKCIGTLKSGHLLQISPGGTREALFATRRYETMWNNRAGFARVAKEANVDIVPIFTRNIRQLFILPEPLQRLFRPLYERYRFPYVPLFGVFPVKLVTFVGKPIAAGSTDSAEELAQLTKRSIEALITEHQRFPARVIEAIGERFRTDVKID